MEGEDKEEALPNSSSPTEQDPSAAVPPQPETSENHPLPKRVMRVRLRAEVIADLERARAAPVPEQVQLDLIHFDCPEKHDIADVRLSPSDGDLLEGAIELEFGSEESSLAGNDDDYAYGEEGVVLDDDEINGGEESDEGNGRTTVEPHSTNGADA